MAEHMVSTIDNPFNPFTQFDDWYAFDERAGYHTTAFLARVLVSSHELSDADQSQVYELAVNEIVRMNVLGIYVKVANPDNSTDSEDPALSITQ